MENIKEQVKQQIKNLGSYSDESKQWFLDNLDTLLEHDDTKGWLSEILSFPIPLGEQAVRPDKIEDGDIKKDLEKFEEVVEGKEHDLPAEEETPPRPKLAPATIKKQTSGKSPLMDYDLADILSRVKMRTEAGLTMNPQDARLIAEIIKNKNA